MNDIAVAHYIKTLTPRREESCEQNQCTCIMCSMGLVLGSQMGPPQPHARVYSLTYPMTFTVSQDAHEDILDQIEVSTCTIAIERHEHVDNLFDPVFTVYPCDSTGKTLDLQGKALYTCDFPEDEADFTHEDALECLGYFDPTCCPVPLGEFINESWRRS